MEETLYTQETLEYGEKLGCLDSSLVNRGIWHSMAGAEGKWRLWVKTASQNNFLICWPDSFDPTVLRGSLPLDGNLFWTDGTGLGYEPQRQLLAKDFPSFLMNGLQLSPKPYWLMEVYKYKKQTPNNVHSRLIKYK